MNNAALSMKRGSEMTTETKTINQNYRRTVPPISAADATAEPPADRVFKMPEATLPEKPVKPMPMFTLHALIDDFPFDVQFSGSVDQLAATVKRLRELGAVPPTIAARAAVQEERERAAPVCEFHGPMKESSKRPGTYYCPAKMGNGDYCRSKA